MLARYVLWTASIGEAALARISAGAYDSTTPRSVMTLKLSPQKSVTWALEDLETGDFLEHTLALGEIVQVKSSKGCQNQRAKFLLDYRLQKEEYAHWENYQRERARELAAAMNTPMPEVP